MLKFLAKLVVGLGGKKAIKNLLLDLFTKILVKEVINPKAFAKEIHDAVQERGRNIIGAKRYESIEKQVLEPFATELLRLWKTD